MAELLSMRDIANLARVQRPVVSMWRRRSRATSRPFPPAHEWRGSQEFFARQEVVAWLEDTGRGNNPEARADVAAHSVLNDTSTRDSDALSALLALRRLHGGSLAGLSVDDLLDLADAHDPDDHVLLSEIERADDLPGLAGAAEALVEAAWGELAAHRRIVETRLRLPGTGLAQAALTEQARRFLLSVFGPLTRDLGSPAVMDPTGCAVGVLPEFASALELPALVLDVPGPAGRLLRRELLLADVPYRTVAPGNGDWLVAGPVAHLLVLPAPDAPAAGPLEQLNLLEEVSLQLDDQQLLLCLAPAATLVEPLDGEPLARRDQLLRDGLVRAIVRLPAGMRPAQAPELSGLWLLGHPDGSSAADRRTLVANLADRPLREMDGLGDDLVAARQGREGARRRAWAHLHPVPTAELLSGRGSLVPPRPARIPTTTRTGADWVVGLRAADTGGRLAGYRLDASDGFPETVTIAQAAERGWLRVLPGRRIDLTGLPHGSVPVVDAPDALRPRRTQSVPAAGPRPDDPHPHSAAISHDNRSVDRLALLSRQDVDLTEPGDIIFSVKPSPAAIVDTAGGALVLAPARILRLRPGAPFVPAQVAAHINQATTTSWRTWSLPPIRERDRDTLGEALTHLADERARLVAELTRLDALTHDLTSAVESRQLSITKENHGPSQG
jgi:hypothetical protein